MVSETNPGEFAGVKPIKQLLSRRQWGLESWLNNVVESSLRKKY